MHRSLPKSQDVRRLLRHQAELELSDDAVLKLKWFLYCSEHYYNVSLTCRHFGISRSTFLRWAHRFDPADIKTLEEQSRRPMKMRTSETDIRTIELIGKIRQEYPEMGKEKVSELLVRKHGIVLSSSTVGRIITRHGLFFGESESHKAKRRRALERHTAEASETEREERKVKPTHETDADTETGMLPLPGLTS